MLSVAEISNRIQDPQLVIPEDLSTLQELSDKYPYTQLFSILYLKALSKAGDPRFEEELGKHSYRISDRVQLYELIESSPLAIDSKTVDTENVITKVSTIKEETVQKAEEDLTPAEETLSITELNIETIASTESLTEEIKPEVEEVKIEPSLKTEIIETSSEVEPIEVERSPIIEEEIVISTDSITKEKDSEVEEIIEETTANDELEESILHHAFAANYHLDELTEEEQEKIDAKESKPSVTQVEVSEPKDEQEISETSFTGWLHSNSNYKERDKSDKAAIKAVVEDFSEFDPSSELFGEVEKPKTEFFSPTRKAKKSLEESELPVSETLAKIYIMQGNYPQAISAYVQLSLAFPEKKIFFANLIEDLEKKINT